MERIVETHELGPHVVTVVEHAGDDEVLYSILVDNVAVTDPPLREMPSLEDIVRIYARVVGTS